jgi:hypothetical protein
MDLNDKRIESSKLRNESLTDRNDLQAKVDKAVEKNTAIVTPRGFENYVRTTYPVVKQGEGVIVVYDDVNSPVTPVRSDMTVWESLLVLWNRITKK